jgi:hypothetical protein
LYGAKNMNMISTGAFQTEMDASNRQPTLANTFAAVWEKKNAKAARAGGVSLMALSLAACGSDDSSTATTATTSTTATTTTTTTTTVTAAALDLTPGTDTVAGGAGDDTIDGSRDIVSGVRFDSLDNSDSITGGTGTDTLSVEMSGGLTIAPASLSGIEVMNVQTIAANSFVNAVNSDALTTLAFNNGAAGAQVSNVQTLLSDIDITNNNANSVTVTYLNTAAAGTADSLDLDLSGFTSAAVSITAAGGAGGYETVTISSGGSATNVISTLTLDAEVTKIAADGAKGLTITTAIAENVLTFDLSAATGATSIATADANSVVTYTGGSGADTFDISVAGGLGSTDVLDGKDGTDILRVEDGDVIGLTAATAMTNISNFEHLFVDTVLGGALRADRVSTDIVDVTLLAAPAAASSVAFAAGTAANVEINATLTGAFTVDDLGSGTSDALTLDMDLGAAATLGGTLTVTDYETVTIDIPDGTLTSGGTGITITPTTGARSTLKITGDSSLTMAGSDIITADTIDATGMVLLTSATTGLVMTTATVATSGADIKGSNGVDTMFGSTSSDSFATNGGNDIVNTQGGSDIVNLGAGFEDVLVTGNTTAATTQIATINGFTTGSTAASSDEVDIDLSDLEAQLAAADDGAAVITAADIVDGNSASLATGTATVIQTITSGAISTTAAGRGVFVLSGSNLANEAAVETALEIGGIFQIQTGTALDDETGNSKADGLLVIYTDGTDSHMAVAYNESDTNSVNGFTAAALDVQNIVTFAGITDVTTFAAANIDWTT